YFGFKLPKGMHKEFADVIQRLSEKQGEVTPDQIMNEFKVCYLDRKEPFHFRKCRFEDVTDYDDPYNTKAFILYTRNGIEKSFEAEGNGPIDAIQRGLQKEIGAKIKVLDYNEHALGGGANAKAAAYIHMLDCKTGNATFGVGVSSNITRASVRAIFSALNRLNLG
ncbi:MAG TPA: 2-isopropylmalate synthase, partial [Lachnospiraceae bacterium]|nr:2-isopropylmalate synthase [Lachnospiraceae bacterium]